MTAAMVDKLIPFLFLASSSLSQAVFVINFSVKNLKVVEGGARRHGAGYVFECSTFQQLSSIEHYLFPYLSSCSLLLQPPSSCPPSLLHLLLLHLLQEQSTDMVAFTSFLAWLESYHTSWSSKQTTSLLDTSSSLPNLPTTTYTCSPCDKKLTSTMSVLLHLTEQGTTCTITCPPPPPPPPPP